MGARGERVTANFKDLFDQLVDIPESNRESFFKTHCAGNADLEASLRHLLAADADADAQTFWRHSAVEIEAASLELEPDGELIGPYRLKELIGAGGMGRVYRAVRNDAAYDKSVAIKRLKRGMDADEIVARFRAERQILANLEHPNIARLLDGGSGEDGLPYLVMEYVEGQSLDRYLAAKALTIPQRLRLFQSICAPVHYAHQRMVIHRDLKPGNILIDAAGVPKLLDFGIAKLLAPGGGDTVVGLHALTPKYASPEQARGEPVTTASDVYSLGVLLREMLDGATMPRDLDNIVTKALDPDPARRYSSVDQLSEDVGNYLEGRPVVARGRSWTYVSGRFIARNRLLVAASIVVIAMLAGGFVITRRAQVRAERRFEDLRALAHSVVYDYAAALKEVPGALPVRKRLVSDSLRYLDKLSAEAAGNSALERDLVDGYVQIASLQGDAYQPNLGDANGALPVAERAVRLGERLVAREPNPDTWQSLGEAYALKGDLLQSAGDLAGAEREWRKQLGLIERAAEARPGPDAQLQIAQLLWNLGDLYGSPGLPNLGKLEQAVDFYRRSLAMARGVYAAHPEIPSAATRVYWSMDALAQALLAEGRTGESMPLATELVHLGESLVADPARKARWTSNLSLGYDHLGRQFVTAHDLPHALENFRKAEQLAMAALAADPDDAGLQRKLGIIEGYLSNALAQNGEAQLAVDLGLRSLGRMQALQAKDVTNVDFRSDVAIGHRRVAEALLAKGDFAEAERHADEAASAFEKLSADSPNSYFSLSHARALVVLGDARLGLGRPERAIFNLQNAAAILLGLVNRDLASALNRAEFAHCEWRLSEALLSTGQHLDGLRARAGALGHWKALRQESILTPAARIEMELAHAQN